MHGLGYCNIIKSAMWLIPSLKDYSHFILILMESYVAFKNHPILPWNYAVKIKITFFVYTSYLKGKLFVFNFINHFSSKF